MEKAKPLTSLTPLAAPFAFRSLEVSHCEEDWAGGPRKKRQFAESLGVSTAASDKLL